MYFFMGSLVKREMVGWQIYVEITCWAILCMVAVCSISSLASSASASTGLSTLHHHYVFIRVGQYFSNRPPEPKRICSSGGERGEQGGKAGPRHFCFQSILLKLVSKSTFLKLLTLPSHFSEKGCKIYNSSRIHCIKTIPYKIVISLVKRCIVCGRHSY